MTGRCNVCGWSDRFLRLDRGREGTVCRNCGSTSRDRAVAHAFARVLDEDQAVFRWTYRLKTRLLDSGTRGSLAMYFRMKFDCRGTELPYDDETFDFVVAADVFDRAGRDIEAIGEVQRVLKSGGYLVLTAPHDGDLIDVMRAPDFYAERIAVDVPEFGIAPQSVFVGRKDRPVALSPARALRAGSTGPMIPFRLFVALKYGKHPFSPVRDFCPYNFVRGFPHLFRDARHARSR
ncbi:MAG TPA: methyltransferase domain-containing protein [Candidatus Krumholzibacteria bacterium]|nr:methyltransferase domain-containing protein [Candidatus Krumholzibacteria bacterium]